MTMTSASISLAHHGASASSLVWIQNPDSSSSVVYSSHGIVNICDRTISVLTNQPLWTVRQTLRTATAGSRMITCLAAIATYGPLVCGCSDGTVILWSRGNHSTSPTNKNDNWTEQVLVLGGATNKPAITAVDGLMLDNGQVLVVTCTHAGVQLVTATTTTTSTTVLATYTANTVHIKYFSEINLIILLVGTAAPRYNKIQLYTCVPGDTFKYAGHLLGHEDWITGFSWDGTLLASASQDCKIRLWNFSTTIGEVATLLDDDATQDAMITTTTDDDMINDNLDSETENDGEARLELYHPMGVTRITLEALLYGHEEGVTSVAWHPNPSLYHQDRILISSSMDRTCLLWSCHDVIWAPVGRVGSAGGILGGSRGSTLLGFVHVCVEPLTGLSLIGQAHGGALHVWALERQEMEQPLTTEELVLHNKWRATPCVTGHFDGVTDLAWEASRGDYLLTVSKDQTCRLWAPIDTLPSSMNERTSTWVELARPQVHGYDLAAITSISTPKHLHVIVTGADEKEARAFDAPLTTTKLLQAVIGTRDEKECDVFARVERAYIPSLGLSNKASAADGAEANLGDDGDTSADDSEQISLPLERDLGAVSLWPEIRKLYGHNTELFCLTSTLAAQSGAQIESAYSETLVASSAKAREAQDASIRIWDAEQGKCIQTLLGGHKSTVATMAFSSDGKYLASSGKDRRLCIWKRQATSEKISFELATSVDSAHKRILWSVDFCPHDPTLLVSGSRDGAIRLWQLIETDDGTQIHMLATLEASWRNNSKLESVTALAFCPVQSSSGDTIFAVGLECGLLELWGVSKDRAKCELILSFDHHICHIDTVTRLAWKPKADGKQILASCSLDYGCRVFEVEIN